MNHFGKVTTPRPAKMSPGVWGGCSDDQFFDLFDGFSIATPGRAEDDGYEGDLLAVRNVKSGMVLMGRLASGGVVLVR